MDSNTNSDIFWPHFWSSCVPSWGQYTKEYEKLPPTYIRGSQTDDSVFQSSHNFSKLKWQVYYQIVLGILANINLILELPSQIWKIEAVLEKFGAKYGRFETT